MWSWVHKLVRNSVTPLPFKVSPASWKPSIVSTKFHRFGTCTYEWVVPTCVSWFHYRVEEVHPTHWMSDSAKLHCFRLLTQLIGDENFGTCTYALFFVRRVSILLLWPRLHCFIYFSVCVKLFDEFLDSFVPMYYDVIPPVCRVLRFYIFHPLVTAI